jgi:DNA-binding transcriptional LysR family regulator
MKASRLQAESVATELFDRTGRTAELLERSRELYDSLRSLCDRNEALRTQSQSIVEHARALLADEILMRYLIVVAALRRSQAA